MTPGGKRRKWVMNRGEVTSPGREKTRKMSRHHSWDHARHDEEEEEDEEIGYIITYECVDVHSDGCFIHMP